MAPRSVSRGSDLEILSAIVELGRAGLSSERIADELAFRYPEREQLPGPRAIRRRLQQALGPAATRRRDVAEEEWRLDAADPAAAALVVPAWGAAMRYLEAPVSLSRPVAEWIERLRIASPSMPALVAWSLAIEYVAGVENRRNLDRYVALELWRDQAELARLVEAGWLEMPLTAWRIGLEERAGDPFDELLRAVMQLLALSDMDRLAGVELTPRDRAALRRLAEALEGAGDRLQVTRSGDRVAVDFEVRDLGKEDR